MDNSFYIFTSWNFIFTFHLVISSSCTSWATIERCSRNLHWASSSDSSVESFLITLLLSLVSFYIFITHWVSFFIFHVICLVLSISFLLTSVQYGIYLRVIKLLLITDLPLENAGFICKSDNCKIKKPTIDRKKRIQTSWLITQWFTHETCTWNGKEFTSHRIIFLSFSFLGLSLVFIFGSEIY